MRVQWLVVGPCFHLVMSLHCIVAVDCSPCLLVHVLWGFGAANNPNIRIFTVGQGTQSNTPLSDLETIEQVGMMVA